MKDEGWRRKEEEEEDDDDDGDGDGDDDDDDGDDEGFPGISRAATRIAWKNCMMVTVSDAWTVLHCERRWARGHDGNLRLQTCKPGYEDIILKK